MGIDEKIFNILLDKNICTKEDLDKVKKIQEQYPSKIGNILLNTGIITNKQYITILSEILKIKVISEDEIDLEKKVFFGNISTDYFIENNIFPFYDIENNIGIILDYNLNYDKVFLLEDKNNNKFELYLGTEELITKLKNIYLEETNEIILEDDDRIEKLKELASEAPVIKMINLHFNKAVELNASDIHYESFKEGMHVRLRIDGVLIKIDDINQNNKKAVIARLKLLSKMNISENRLPQDGRISIKISNQSIDIRSSSVPTAFGESFVLRLLGKQTISYSLNSLDFYIDHLELLKEIVSKSNGIFLTTGPTGSGKTTTLYSLLNEINSEDTKIITVEDPVEYELRGINQVQVKSQIDFTFNNALRSILRQDPDMIMIGEIRDAETAKIAIQASLTGHVVISTLHTNSALGAITRLLDMGIEFFLLKSSINGLMAQRLVRKFCEHCKEKIEIDEKIKEELDIKKLLIRYSFINENYHNAKGCKKCNFTGYKGRIPVAEIVKFDEKLQTIMENDKNFNDLSKLNVRTLFEDAILKFIEGKTSLDEILRIRS